MRRSARGALARGIRLSGGARSPEDRRRVSGDYRGAAGHRLSAFHPAAAFHVDRAVSPRSAEGQAIHGLRHSPRHVALLPPGGRSSVQIPHLLRHHPVAPYRDRSRLDHARPAETAIAGRRRIRRAAHRVNLQCRRHGVRQTGGGSTAFFPGWRKRPGPHHL